MAELFDFEALDKKKLIEEALMHVCPGRIETFRQLNTIPVMARRRGHYFWDLDGRKLFDVHINGGTYNLGHRNPELISALKEALRHYDMGNHHFVSIARTELARTLIATMPGGFKYALFTAGGGEAIDAAIRSARRATGRRLIISFEGAYHGHGGLGLAAGDPEMGRFFHSEAPEKDFFRVPFNDTAALEEALKNSEAAALLCEMIPATSGFLMPDSDYYREARKLCDKYGTMLIADEVQTGLGRTGSTWACQTFGIEPDILVAGKGLSGGLYPIAAALLSEEAGAWLSVDGWGYSSTTGGSELGCAVALKVLEIIQRPAVVENIKLMSTFFKDSLKEVKARFPFLLEVRQQGLVMGLKFDHPLGGALMTACAFQSGLWAFPAGYDRSVLQFKPTLLITESEGKKLIRLLAKSIKMCENLLEGGADA